MRGEWVAPGIWGTPQFKENDKDVMDCTPEMRRVELQPGDFAVVLASDSLKDVLSTQLSRRSCRGAGAWETPSSRRMTRMLWTAPRR